MHGVGSPSPSSVSHPGLLGAAQALREQAESGPLPGWKEVKDPAKVPSAWQMFKGALVDAGLASKTGFFKQSYELREQYKANIEGLQSAFVARLSEREITVGDPRGLARELIPFSLFKSPDAGAVERTFNELEQAHTEVLVRAGLGSKLSENTAFDRIKLDHMGNDRFASKVEEAVIQRALKQTTGSIADNVSGLLARMFRPVDQAVMQRLGDAVATEHEQATDKGAKSPDVEAQLLSATQEAFIKALGDPQADPLGRDSFSALFERQVNERFPPTALDKAGQAVEGFAESAARTLRAFFS